MMDVRELSRDQLDELKQNYVFESGKNLSYEELADSINIPDEVIFEYYAGVDFVMGDFWCTAGQENF